MKRAAAATTSLLLLASSSGASGFVQSTAGGRYFPSAATTASSASTSSSAPAFSCSAPAAHRQQQRRDLIQAGAGEHQQLGRRRKAVKVSVVGISAGWGVPCFEASTGEVLFSVPETDIPQQRHSSSSRVGVRMRA